MKEISTKLPQLILMNKSKRKGSFLGRLTCEAGMPYVKRTFSKTDDSRVIEIKKEIDGEERVEYSYYSETPSKNILTVDLGYNFEGDVDVLGNDDNEIAWLDAFHSEKDPKGTHIKRLENIKNLKEELDPEEISKTFEGIFYSIQRYI